MERGQRQTKGTVGLLGDKSGRMQFNAFLPVKGEERENGEQTEPPNVALNRQNSCLIYFKSPSRETSQAIRQDAFCHRTLK